MSRFALLAEAFIVCQGYSPPEGFEPHQLTRILEARATSHAAGDEGAAVGTKSWPNNVLVPFLACGDLSGYDADQSYALDDTKVRLKPVQPPTTPAYMNAIKLLKRK
jgi:tRNA (cytidine32/guanosine34-2'-O)-methyltransferase